MLFSSLGTESQLEHPQQTFILQAVICSMLEKQLSFLRSLYYIEFYNIEG